MLSVPWLVPSLWAFGVGAWALAHRRHCALVDSVPARVSVGGTRGKTTVVRLLAEALRLSGRCFGARAAGRRPEECLGGGRIAEATRWRPIPRVGPADLDELRRWLATVIPHRRPDLLVVENHAIAPESMQAVNEHLLHPTFAVITDATPDHLDEWPADPKGVARLHVDAAPPETAIVTSDPTVREVAEELGRDCTTVETWSEPADIPAWMRSHLAVVWDALDRLEIPKGADLRAALADAARELLPRPLALRGGAHFIDLFDANDPLSAARSLSSVSGVDDARRRVALFAHRRDRPWRWKMFRPWLGESFNDVHRFDDWPDSQVTAWVKTADQDTLLVGLGNAVGPAHEMLSWIPTEADTR